MRMAEVLAKRGTCDRKQVGAIIAIDHRAISWGHNGAPPGLPHCDENLHGWANVPVTFTECPYCHTVIGPKHPDPVREHGCRNATHAEANALAFAAKQGISTDGAELYVTLSPCDVCSRLLVAAGIVAVYYKEAYRDESGLRLLRSAGLRTVYTTGEPAHVEHPRRHEGHGGGGD
jgi:dCMP deaminase